MNLVCTPGRMDQLAQFGEMDNGSSILVIR